MKCRCVFYKFLVALFFVTNIAGQKTIGAIFDDVQFNLEAAFTLALADASADEESPFEGKVIKTPPGDVAEAEKAMCSMLESNIFAVCGPATKNALQHIQSIADFLEIPHLLTNPIITQNRNWSAVNLYPHHNSYSQVFSDIIEAKGWTEFTVIYEDSELLPGLENIFNVYDFGDQTVSINVVQLPDGDDFRLQLQTVKTSGSLNYLVSCRTESLEQFLIQAQQVGIMSDDNSYLIMNPDFQTIDIEPFKHGGSNITGIRFFDPELESIQNFITSVNEKVKELSEGQIENAISENGLTLELALVYDAVTLYTAAIKAMEFNILFQSAPYGMLKESLVKLEGNDRFEGFGIEIIEELAKMNGFNYTFELQVDGNYGSYNATTKEATGMMKKIMDGTAHFAITDLTITSTRQKAVDFTSPFMNLGITILYKKPTKEPPNLFSFISPFSSGTGSSRFVYDLLYHLLTPSSDRFVVTNNFVVKLEGNDRFEGFGIEIIEELAKMNGFNYTFELQVDGNYGSYNATTKEATGMMKKIMDGTAHFAITDLTITSTRQKAVDFTSPFMNLGITILYKKPTKEPPNLFSFISPFSSGVWVMVAGAYVGVSLLLFVLGRIAPEEWQNPYPCIEEPETLDNQWTLANSFWFTLGAVLTQGSELAPIAVSTRMAGSMWWFFTLIMVSSYTANLAAFLTVESKFYAIKSITDLANNPYGMTYGAKLNGATYTFFKESDNLLYQKIFKYMEAHPELQTANNDIGLDRVKSDKENYAFLMESTSIEYMVERNCDVAQVGGLLDSKGYGIAMKKDSPYRQPMSESILQMQEKGTLTRMKNKWWKEKRGGGMCTDDDAGGGDAQPLVLANVGGVFIVLVAGSGMAVICAFLEMIVDVWFISHRMKVSFREELIAELRFIMSFSGDTKPVRHRESTGSGSGSSKKTPEEEEKREDDQISLKEEDNRSPTPSARSTHSRHTLHSRRPSNATHMARMRKYSARSARL